MENNKKKIRQIFAPSRYARWAILIGVTIIFTVIHYPSLLITKDSHNLGDIAERNIKAPKNFFVEDKAVTETNRKRAVEAVLTVYDYDATLAETFARNVKQPFKEISDIIEAETESRGEDTAEPSKTDTAEQDNRAAYIHDQIWQRKADFEEKIGITISNGAYSILEKEKFSGEIPNLIIRILTTILENGVVTNKELLLREIDKGITLRTVGTNEETIIRGLKRFYGLDQAKTMVRIVGQPLLKDLDYNLRNLVVDFVQRLIRPNITLNRSETEERKKIAVSEVNPVLYKIKAGEMLLREGERVTEVQLIKLKALQSQTNKGKIIASSAGTAILILCLLSTTYILYARNQISFSHALNKNLLFIASVLVTFFAFAAISASLSESISRNSALAVTEYSLTFGIPIASGAMTVCLFMGLDIAIPIAVVLAACTAILFQNRLEVFLYFFVNSTMAAYWIQNCRERKVFITAGAKLGLLNVVLATGITFFLPESSALESVIELLWIWAFAFMGGIGAGIVTAGIVPLLEVAFDYTTDISLLELANLDRSILRRLMIEAPGTYHHSVIVGSLVEAAAAEIGANPLLAKVCGYYHDIGKIKKPLYFIENQTDGKNKHDKLAPSMSKRILIAHVKDGVEMAGKYKLGQVITDTIRQSHGTSLISYFYEKARQLKGEDAVEIDDFRYPGPKPQTREAGLVMLADVVEAASRTLENPTPSRIQGLVQNLINKVFSDGQLDECELTLKDLHKIAKSFNKILYGIHHHRIEYPDKIKSINGKVKDGSSDRQQAKQVQDISGEDKERGPGHLKRLGLS